MIAAALQRGIPLHHRPFAELARELGASEADVLDALARLRADGAVRRFGAVFDARRLGYRSALCAADVPPDAIDGVAARVAAHPGVTHCYRRQARGVKTPELWFTLSAPAETFDDEAACVRAAAAPFTVHLLPALRRYKVDVVFGAASRAREESVTGSLPPPDAQDRRIIAAIQGDTEVRADYFEALAARLGMNEWDLLAKLEIWRRNGRLKRIGLLLNHRAAGWGANGMCCWRIAGDTTDAGRALAASPHVTHCYERPVRPGFPYNLFAMVHCRTELEAEARFAELAALLPADTPRAMLVSTKEYKKTSMTFFASPV